MKKNWTSSSKNFMKSCLQIMTVADVGTVVRCTAEVFQKKIWRKMQNIWELRALHCIGRLRSWDYSLIKFFILHSNHLL